LCHPDYPVPEAQSLELKVILLETSGPLLRGSQVLCFFFGATPAVLDYGACIECVNIALSR
jgi:hypothetical protein